MTSNAFMAEEIELEFIEKNMLELQKQVQSEGFEKDGEFRLFLAAVENCIADIQAVDRKKYKTLRELPPNICARICSSMMMIDQFLNADEDFEFEDEFEDDCCDDDDCFDDDECCESHHGCCDRDE